MQADLEAAQNRHLKTLSESVKGASTDKSPSTMEMLTSAPITLSVLMALASGGLAVNALNKTFPQVNHPRNPLPRRVRINREAGASPEQAAIAKEVAERELNGEEADQKMASMSLSADQESALWGEMAHLILNSKKASETDVADWAYAVAGGRLQELEDTVAQLGFEPACDMMKGASETPVSDSALDLAVLYLTKSSSLGPLFQLLVAAEVVEQIPSQTKIAACLEPEILNAVIGWAAEKSASYRMARIMPILSRTPVTKSASHSEVDPDATTTVVHRRQAMRKMLQQEINEDSKNDKKSLKGRMANSQNLSGTASELGDGRVHADAKKAGSDDFDMHELIMGIR